jgi:hypothetical protein
MVRTALTAAKPELAERVVTGFNARDPLAQHALISARAALAEAHGRHQEAAEGYADAAARWESFGVVPEQAFALLGQGRCLVALGLLTEAAQPLSLARDIFQELQAAPALAETDALLQLATALSS